MDPLRGTFHGQGLMTGSQTLKRTARIQIFWVGNPNLHGEQGGGGDSELSQGVGTGAGVCQPEFWLLHPTASLGGAVIPLCCSFPGHLRDSGPGAVGGPWRRGGMGRVLGGGCPVEACVAAAWGPLIAGKACSQEDKLDMGQEGTEVKLVPLGHLCVLGLTPNFGLHFANRANLCPAGKGILGKAALSFMGEQRCPADTPILGTATLGPRLASSGLKIGKVVWQLVSLAGHLSRPLPAPLIQ